VVDGATLSFGPGLHLLLGPNGSGKSTVLRLVSGLLEPTSGTVRLFGKDPVKRPEVMRRVGILLDDELLFPLLTPVEFLRYCGMMYGMSPSAANKKTHELLDLLGVTERRKLCKELSHGNQRRVGLAAAMIHDPEILLLDEPELGLDTDGLEILDRILLESRDRGRLLLVASHRADRLEDLADTIHRFEKGRVLIPDEDEAGESKRIRAVE
jgi:ABC-2 type transport system ATP-binding protein